MIIGLSLAVNRGGVLGPGGPTNTVAPVVSGTATVGQTLSTTNGTWSGVGTITYAYQWLDDGVAISGATSNTYTLTAAEEGGFITCRVTATDDNGSTAATSNSVGPVAASSFSPADLFGVGDEGVFHDFSDKSSLFTDLLGTTAVTASGDPVGYATDLGSGNNNTAAPFTSGRGTYTESGGLAGLVIGAASGERLEANNAAGVTGLTSVDECTVMAAYTTNTDPAGRPLLLGATAGDYVEIKPNASSSSIRDNGGGSITVDNTSSASTAGTAVVVAGIKDGSEGRWYKWLSGSGGLAETDTGLGTNAANFSANITIRGDGNTVYAVFFIDRALTTTEFNNLRDWMRAKAGH